MRGDGAVFMAKAEWRGDDLHWHSLEDHSADVAACVEVLLRGTVLGRRLATLAGLDRLDEVQRSRLAYLAALHDAGKVNTGFQAAIRRRVRGIGGHVKSLMLLLNSRQPEARAVVEALNLQAVVPWFGPKAFPGMLGATICHHGRPYGFGGDLDSALWKTRDGLDPVVGARELAAAASSWFPAAFEAGEQLPATAPFQHGWNGLLTLADWLGSDPRLFPFGEEADPSRIHRSREWASEAAERVGLDVRRRRSRLIRRSAPHSEITFAHVSAENEPWPTQALFGDLELPAAGGITVLEAPTGSGKTEAALFYCLRLVAAGLVDGLYFAVPTRAAATQLHRRIHEIAQHAFDTDAPSVALAVPGYLQVDGVSGERLAPFEVLWPEESADRERHRGWAVEHPKRYFAAGLVVGTVDQALLSGLQVRHSQLRAAGLLRHLLVVDEVHSSDAYMTSVLEEVIAHHRAAGGHVFLMSATLALATRRRLTAVPGSQIDLPGVEEAAGAPYPLVMHGDWGSDGMQYAVAAPPLQKRVQVERRPWGGDSVAIASAALDAASRGARVLVLRNTVAGCVATQEELEALAAGSSRTDLLFRCGAGPGFVAPHHSRYARVDRRLLDRAIEEQFGKRAERLDGRIVVATQTVEQSLDIDADLLLTDLCPIDVLLQRIGRLHRHERARPPGFEMARVVVLVPEERDLAARIRPTGRAPGPNGLGTVYADLRALETTWALLEQCEILDLPAQNRELVERALHPEALAQLTSSLEGEAWERHAQWVLGCTLAERRLGRANVADWSVPLDGTYKIPEDRKIETRLGEADFLVRFSEGVLGPFGSAIESLGLPAYWLPGVDDVEELRESELRGEPECSVLASEPLTFRVELGAALRDFVYDRWGIRPLTEDD